MNSSEQKRQARRNRRLERAESFYCDALKEHAPEFAAGRPGAGLDEPTSHTIWEATRNAYPDADPGELRKRVRKKLKDLERLTQGTASIPPPIAVIRRDSSPFSPEAMSLNTALGSLLECFWDDLKGGFGFDEHAANFHRTIARQHDQPANQVRAREEASLSLGRLLFSAIANGGMLLQRKYGQLPDALLNHLRASGDLAWISLSSSEKPASTQTAGTGSPLGPWDRPVRRWFLDPVTLGLAVQWRAVLLKNPALLPPPSASSSLQKYS